MKGLQPPSFSGGKELFFKIYGGDCQKFWKEILKSSSLNHILWAQMLQFVLESLEIFFHKRYQNSYHSRFQHTKQSKLWIWIHIRYDNDPYHFYLGVHPPTRPHQVCTTIYSHLILQLCHPYFWQKGLLQYLVPRAWQWKPANIHSKGSVRIACLQCWLPLSKKRGVV